MQFHRVHKGNRAIHSKNPSMSKPLAFPLYLAIENNTTLAFQPDYADSSSLILFSSC